MKENMPDTIVRVARETAELMSDGARAADVFELAGKIAERVECPTYREDIIRNLHAAASAGFNNLVEAEELVYAGYYLSRATRAAARDSCQFVAAACNAFSLKHEDASLCAMAWAELLGGAAVPGIVYGHIVGYLPSIGLVMSHRDAVASIRDTRDRLGCSTVDACRSVCADALDTAAKEAATVKEKLGVLGRAMREAGRLCSLLGDIFSGKRDRA